MKKSSLNFLNRKPQNLFDTGVQIKHFENVELVLDSAAIPESGTAKVRSRPTVKHFSTSGDGALGFAVPTPTVPVLPPLNGPQSGNTGSHERLPNGGMISIADPEEGQILIPAPPSMAPPPPPPQFIPPSPQYIPPPQEFFGNKDPSIDLAALQPPSMPPPKPPSLTGSTTSEELDPVFIKPPPMAPPKPPSDISSLRSSVPISSPLISAQDIPECPTFTPPLPPMEKPESPLLRNAQKTPPPKPVRLSSIYNFELPPTPTPAATPASSFNPQTTAKLYSVPKTTVLSNQTDKEVRTQHILLLEDTSGNPVGVHINGKASSSVKEVSPGQDVVPPVKPVRRNSSGIQLEKDVEDLNKNLPELPGTTISGEPAKVTIPQEVPNKIQSSVRSSPNTERSQNIPPVQEISQVNERPASPSRTRSYSPLLSHKLQTLRGHEGSSGKEASTSPLALLMAAKNRDKHRSGLSRQSSNKSNSSAESLNVSVQPNETKPNSFTITPIPASSESLLRTEPKQAISAEPKPQSPKIPKQEPSQVPQPVLSISPVKQEDNESAIPFIPPPPEFANSDSEDDVPPSTPPPAPPAKSVAQPLINGPSVTPNDKLSSTYTAPPPTSVTRTEPILKQVVLSKPKAPTGQPPVQPQTQTQAVPMAQTKNQLPVQPTVQPKFQFPAQTPAQLKTQLPPAPTIQPAAPPTTQPPAPPTIQPPPPPTTQPPAPPSTQPPAPPPTKPKAQIPFPPPVQPKTQTQAPPPTQPKAQIPAPPPVQPKTQTQAPPPTQPKAQIPVPPPVQPKTQTQAPPPTQPKTQPPAQTPASVSASQATLLSILQKKMLEMDSKFAPVKEADPNSDEWNSPLSDDDGAAGFPLKSTAKPKSATLPMQTRGLDMKELENKVAKKAQDMSIKAPASNGPQSKHPYGMTFTVRPGTKQPITPVIKTD
ncbi:uncharacterized protein LOC103038691 [Astyanax mexicanus]|uniref:uncharacterized protein LOC103038691 n=1 Tax=Astyanax mexicanus TaxID=7994 RepID=UPI0020CB4AD5|nr:uncharacterized protein LOC103038691 [Astyanax mexicanus]